MPLDTAAAALSDVKCVVEAMGRGLSALVSAHGKLSRDLLDRHQPAAFALAMSLAQAEAAAAMFDYAKQLDRTYESALTRVYVARVLKNLVGTLAFSASDFGLTADDTAPLQTHSAFVEGELAVDNLSSLCGALLERATDRAGNSGLQADHIEMGQVFSRFADERIAPLAEEIHRHDKLIPEHLLSDLAALGVFGISIPEQYGGHFLDHLTMCIASEELSRASLGAGGSVITRPEICAKALLEGGTEEQKATWLPKIASGEHIVSIAVTEPNAGSDVGNLRVAAKPTEGGYLLFGEKTWCTFAGRADLLALLARTGRPEDRHRGLSLFLVEKPAGKPPADEYHFLHEQPGGGRVEGHAIPTVGYRGMHSFTVTFDGWFVPEANRIGAEGEGFALQMKGFAGGRIQTAARAVGLMEAAFRAAIEYVLQRQVFGKTLAKYTLPQVKLVEMATRLQACRQLAYSVARLMDDGKGHTKASLVKLLSCKDAEWVCREAMQLHGGMGYSEEFAVSRYWQDARVLSIFEGAEEILGIYVVARQVLREWIA